MSARGLAALAAVGMMLVCAAAGAVPEHCEYISVQVKAIHAAYAKTPSAGDNTRIVAIQPMNTPEPANTASEHATALQTPAPQSEQYPAELRTRADEIESSVNDAAIARLNDLDMSALQSAADRNRVLGFDGLYIDIGAKDKAEALAKCPVGTYAYFDTPYQPFGDGFVCAKALDDRVGCYTILELMRETYPCDVTFVFAVQEEVGCRGSHGAAYGVQPDIVLNLEGTAANDLGCVDDQFKVCRPTQGVAVSFMDKASIGQPELFAELLRLAEGSGIAHQVKMAVAGGNDSGPIQRTGCGAKVCVLSVPCRYIHSPSTVLCLEDVEAQYLLAKAYLTR